MLAGLILAGGKSSRMGVDKSYLRLPSNNLSMLEHCQQLLSNICKPVLISGSQHKCGISDIHPKSGPLAGIHAGLKQISKLYPEVNEVLVIPIDMPNIGLKELKQLISSGRASEQVTSFESFNFPLYLPIKTQVIHYLDHVFNQSKTLANGQSKTTQYSIKNLINTLQGEKLKPLELDPFNNINTPLQWQQHCGLGSEKS